MTTVSVIVLTMGDRPDELATAVASARRQVGVDVEVVLVVNGGDPDRSLADVVVEPGENLGIPGGRNAGAKDAAGSFLCFLDDDGELLGDGVLAGAVEVMTGRDEVAVVGLRVVDEHGATARRHHPGLRGDVDEAGDVTSFPGGASVVRRSPFEEVGGLCDEFFYGLEETDLAWALIDAGWAIRFEPELRMRHPRTQPSRHPDFHRLTARNRVWLAKRRLPWALAVLYVFDWLIVGLVRSRLDRGALSAIAHGTVEGIRAPIGRRQPMRMRTALRLTRLGRPPII